jgi:hypothetical protein
MPVVVIGVFRDAAELAYPVNAKNTGFNLFPGESDYGVFRDE